jgi:hypothetical protein
VGERLIYRGAGGNSLQVELSRVQSTDLGKNAVQKGDNPAQDEIEQIRTRTNQILERLRDPSTTQEQKAALRTEAGKLADRLNVLLGKKGQ